MNCCSSARATEHFIYKWAAHAFWGRSRYYALLQSRLHQEQERDPGRDFGSCHPGGSRLGCLFAAPNGQRGCRMLCNDQT